MVNQQSLDNWVTDFTLLHYCKFSQGSPGHCTSNEQAMLEHSGIMVAKHWQNDIKSTKLGRSITQGKISQQNELSLMFEPIFTWAHVPHLPSTYPLFIFHLVIFWIKIIVHCVCEWCCKEISLAEYDILLLRWLQSGVIFVIDQS